MLECDLIMKGGITSGVVYPKAITTVAKKYRLRNIGGTSAGAIAAVVAGAAEYRRQSGDGDLGFQKVDDVALELGADMVSLFQPSPPLKRLYGVFFALISHKKGQGIVRIVLLALLKFYGVRAIPGLVLIAIFVVMAFVGSTSGLVVGGLICSGILSVILILLAVLKDIRQGLPNSDFGLCPGTTQNGYDKPAFTDWLTDKIDEVAGNTDRRPLTHGQLKTMGVSVATMTTDLSSRRPYQLPLQSKHHYFSKAEFDRLFPKRVIDAMIEGKQPHETDQTDVPTDLYQLPAGDEFPVILIARFSLSFPGLISAVPLWRYDDQIRLESGRGKISRCLFSDGGISSNFPVHLFDAPLPARPTFGISLTPWEKARHGANRVKLPKTGKQSTDLPVRPPKNLIKFLMSIFSSSKDWQDTLQAILPGTADRIVEVRLDEAKEGGMNLAMPPEIIAKLVEYGAQAGKVLVSQFDFDEHRWQRALTILPAFHGTLSALNTAYSSRPAGAGSGAQGYSNVLRDYPSKSYSENTKTWRADVLDAYAQTLAEQGKADGLGAQLVEGTLPSTDASIRLMADANRVPRRG